MDMKFVYTGLFTSFILVLALWVFFRKQKALCLGSTIALVVVIAAELLAETFTDNEFLLSVATHILLPGLKTAAVFVSTSISFDDENPVYTVLSYIFALIFYSIIFSGILMAISCIWKDYFCRKTDGVSESQKTR
jgi:hypothetical protein